MLPVQNITKQDFEDLIGDDRLNGLYNIPDTWYFAAPGLNSSSLRDFVVSPLRYKIRKSMPRTQTPAMVMGSAIHCKVLEPHLFDDKYLVTPQFSGSKTKLEANGGCREAWDQFKKDSETCGKDVLDYWDNQNITQIDLLIKSHKPYRTILDNSYKELSAFWTCKATGLKLKARFDMISEQFGISDLKTTSKGVENFMVERQISDGYWLQMGFYLKAVREMPELESVRYIGSWLFQSVSPGYESSLVYIDQFPEKKIDNLVQSFADCYKTQDFPTIYHESHKMELPPWIMN
jgi:hypothetical protein